MLNKKSMKVILLCLKNVMINKAAAFYFIIFEALKKTNLGLNLSSKKIPLKIQFPLKS